MQTQSLSVGQHTIFLRTAKSKSKYTLLFVHGIGVSSGYWLPLTQELEDEYNLCIPDLPGYGKSSRPEHALRTAELADILHDFIKQLKLTNVILVGNSYGCQIVIDMLYRYHPSEVRKAVLLGPTVYADERSIGTQLLRLAQDAAYEPTWSLFVLAREYIQAGARHSLESLKYAIHDRPEDKLHTIHMPVLVVRGEYDSIVPTEWTQILAEKIPKASVAEIPDCGHIVHFGGTSQTADVIRNFTDSFAQRWVKRVRRFFG
jgi:2-hydroxy-6-oxonona-2,4-dienedioate hydrolase